MMKTVLLLAFAVFVSGASAKEDKTLLGELIEELKDAIKNLPKQSEGDKEIFMKDLKCDEFYPKHMFCQAEKEIKLKLSGLTNYTHFRTDGTLMRNLNRYNNEMHRKKTCKLVAKDQEEITVHDFMIKLMKCVQSEYSQVNKNKK